MSAVSKGRSVRFPSPSATRRTFSRIARLTPACRPKLAGVTVVFEGVPQGRFAIQVHHDVNGNGKVDVHPILRMPSEPGGFGAGGRMAFLSFDKASTEIGEEPVVIRVTIR
jgi:uncharacterized protein (DUF2141 family)